jgi:hypothetical protein
LRRLELGNQTIPEHFLQHIVISAGRVGVSFGIVAPEEDGKRLEDELRRLEKEHAIRYFASEDSAFIGPLRSGPGLCDIINLTIEKDTSRVPVLYRIRGQLSLVT